MKTSWPVAELAVSSPITNPRRVENQRVAMVAPSTRAVRPVPNPTTMPHSRMSSQTRVMRRDRASPLPISASDDNVTLRTPNRLISAAANGPIRPNSSRRIARAPDISDVSQPNSRCNGSRSTAGAPTAPATTSMVRNVTATTTQP